MGNTALAVSYFDMAIEDGLKRNSVKQLNWAYTAKAEFLLQSFKEIHLYFMQKELYLLLQTPALQIIN